MQEPNAPQPGLPPRRFTRRGMMRALALGGASFVIGARPLPLSGQPDPGNPTLAFLETLAREDGGYAWPGQNHSHLTSSFAVVGSYHLLGRTPPRKARLAAFIRSHHPWHLKKLEQEHRAFDFQQIQSLAWLGEDVSSFIPIVRAWVAPTAYLKQYERGGCPVFSQEVAAFLCRPLLKLPSAEIGQPWLDYLEARRRRDGTYNNTPASDGTGGHAVNTWYGLQAQLALRGTPRATQTLVDWLRACQLPSGGFAHEPKPDMAPVATATCTWAAVQALKLLGGAPADQEACIAFLFSLLNEDGGFGEQPGWASNPLSTYHAVEALRSLGQRLDRPSFERVRRESGRRPRSRGADIAPGLPSGLQVFSIQIEAHGTGSPADAVELARALRIHLWGAKNAKPAWIEAAAHAATGNHAPVNFFVANEEYGTWVAVPGMGTYSHTSDIIAPVGSQIGPSLAAGPPVTWQEFRASRVGPLQRAGGRLVWQFGENEELVHLFLADSLQRRSGYSAVSTYHFGNPDFTNSEPFLHLYRGQIPFIALQDAHGDEPWWFADMTTGFRTLFFGREPTWAAWLEALDRNWVVAVRRDSVTGNRTWIHAATDAHAAYALRQQADWRWWDNAHIQRPMISLVAVRPQDQFEAARPQSGLTLRVRCAWENTTQGRPKKPLAEFTRLVVDGTPVAARLVAPRLPAGGLGDFYHEYPMPSIVKGKHTATAFARVLATGGEMQRRIEFVVD